MKERGIKFPQTMVTSFSAAMRGGCEDRWPDKCATAASYGFCTDAGLKEACPVSCDDC